MGLLSWIILGVVAGWAACIITNQRKGLDYFIYILVGIAGAVIGGLVSNLVSQVNLFSFTWVSLFVAFLGTGVFLGVVGAIRR